MLSALLCSSNIQYSNSLLLVAFFFVFSSLLLLFSLIALRHLYHLLGVKHPQLTVVLWKRTSLWSTNMLFIRTTSFVLPDWYSSTSGTPSRATYPRWRCGNVKLLTQSPSPCTTTLETHPARTWWLAGAGTLCMTTCGPGWSTPVSWRRRWKSVVMGRQVQAVMGTNQVHVPDNGDNNDVKDDDGDNDDDDDDNDDDDDEEVNIPATCQCTYNQRRICSDSCTCCHTEIEVADPTSNLTQSQHSNMGPTGPSVESMMSGIWHGWPGKLHTGQ